VRGVRVGYVPHGVHEVRGALGDPRLCPHEPRGSSKVRDEIKRRVTDLIERIKRGEMPPVRGRSLSLKLG
jgi:hypothetical protein